MKGCIVLVVSMVVLCLAPAAMADATQSVYDIAGTKIQKNLGKTTPTVKVKSAKASSSKPKAASGTLPFTGMDLGLVGFAGVALAGLGFSLRRLARDTDS